MEHRRERERERFKKSISGSCKCSQCKSDSENCTKKESRPITMNTQVYALYVVILLWRCQLQWKLISCVRVLSFIFRRCMPEFDRKREQIINIECTHVLMMHAMDDELYAPVLQQTTTKTQMRETREHRAFFTFFFSFVRHIRPPPSTYTHSHITPI